MNISTALKKFCKMVTAMKAEVNMICSRKSTSTICCWVAVRQLVFCLPLLIVITSFVSPYWLVSDRFHFGLWQICQDTHANGTLTCRDFREVRLLDYGKLKVARFCETSTLVTTLVSFIMGTISFCTSKRHMETVLNYMTNTAGLAVLLSVFGHLFMSATTDNGKFGVSFYLGAVGILLNIFVFIYGMAAAERLKDSRDLEEKNETTELKVKKAAKSQQTEKPV